MISTLAVMGFNERTRRMQVESLHPGVTRQDVVDNTGFEMLFAEPLSVTEEPTDIELEILRTQVDPQGMVIGRADS